jgi:hypothetical protein
VFAAADEKNDKMLRVSFSPATFSMEPASEGTAPTMQMD